MRKSILGLLILFFLTTDVILAQDSISNGLKKYTEVIPKSPVAAAIERYNFYPVNLCVGLPDVTIPIYTIKSGKLEVPISLSYHMGGIKVDDVASWVGLGWTLNAGGSISRSVKGLCDENGILKYKGETYPYKDFKGNNISVSYPMLKNVYQSVKDIGNGEYQNMSLYLDNLADGWPILDGQSDIYTYKANNISGSFKYNVDENKELIQVPNTDNKIIRSDDNFFTIVGDDGTVYIFKDYERESILDSYNTGYISTWLLTKIISSDGKDEIDFIYESNGGYQDLSPSTTLWEGYQYEQLASGSWQRNGYTFETRKSITTVYRSEKRLSKIGFRGGTVEFKVSGTKRKDLRDSNLESITVKDENEKQIKKVTFDYDYFKSISSKDDKYSYRLKLKNIKMWDVNNKNSLPYNFYYNENNILPPYFSGWNTDKSYLGKDYMGYNNGIMTNLHLVGKLPDSVIASGLLGKEADRKPDEKHMKSCLLSQINYPTGGSAIFEMEANRDDQGKLLGGMRLQKMILKADSESPEIVNTYHYENANILYEPIAENYIYNDFVRLCNEGVFYKNTSYTSEPLTILGSYSGSPVIYQTVTKTDMDISGNMNGKTIYHYPQAAMGTTVDYTGGASTMHADDIRFIDVSPLTWLMGEPLRIEYYKQENGIFKLIKETINEYMTYDQMWNYNIGGTNMSVKTIPVGVSASLRYKIYYWGLAGPSPKDDHAKAYHDMVWSYEFTGIRKLIKTIERNYENSNAVQESIVQYEYANLTQDFTSTKRNHLLTKQVTPASTSNETIISLFRYPQDYLTLPTYKNMADKNILSPIIEKITYKNTISKDNELNREKVEYTNFGELAYYPKSVQTSVTGGEFRSDLIFDKYDEKGNVLQYTTLDGVSTSYLWSYNYQYPIAEIKNATYKQLTDIITENTLNLIAQKKEPTESDLQTINNLRNNRTLNDVIITTYTYKPLTGIRTVVDPTNIKNSYEYDDFGRLAIVKDLNDSYISRYEYGYANRMILFCYLENEYPLNSYKTFTINVDNGSGNYSYNWVLTDPSGKTVATSTTKTFGCIFTQPQNHNLKCIVTDLSTSQKAVMNRTVKVNYAPINLTFDDRKGYLLSTPYTISADVTGGSGNYSYTWALKDTQGNTIRSFIDKTNKLNVSFTEKGTFKVVCTIKDLITLKEVEFIKTIEVFSPITATLNSSASYVYLDYADFNIVKSGGSNVYSCLWKLRDMATNTIIRGTTQYSTSSWSDVLLDNAGQMELTCTIEDYLTGQKVSLLKIIEVKNQPSIKVQSEYFLNNASIFTVENLDNPSNYTYSWSLINKDNNLIIITANTTQFSHKFTQTGNMELKCEIKDKTTLGVRTIAKTFSVAKPLIEFRNVTVNRTNQNKHVITAYVYCYESVNINFNMETLIENGGSIIFKLGSMSITFNQSGSKSEAKTVRMGPGEIYVEIEVNIQDPIMGRYNASLWLTGTENSDLKIGKVNSILYY